MTDEYRFKLASEDDEFAQIHALNYRAFVEEIPQHPPNPERRLIDKFHDENSYIICLLGDQLIGMLALRSQRPFSLDGKLADLDSYLPPYRSLCEVRLLAVEPAHRRAGVFGGLLRTAFEFARAQGHDLAVMSGTVRELALYERMGWVPFGPLVGTAAAQYQPMFWTLEQVQLAVPRLEKGAPVPDERPIHNVVNLLPGPVTLHPTVQAAMAATPVSHRLKEFVTDVKTTQQILCLLTGATFVELLMGSGTLANDAIAAHLALLDEPGLMLANGEFGSRLTDHARRAGLQFETLSFDWGQPFDYERVAEALANRPVGWLWTNHCETSTGVLNDLPRLQALCRQTGTRLVVDAISSIGLAPVDLSGVYLASGVSGKGLGSVPGIAMVYYNQPIAPQPDRIPSYLDIGLYATSAGVPFTLSSNLLYAL
ncbi:MAG: GNAT family N-acetyltransferase, partial [Anaerolineales bacterium]|nr:GNAT family N-acetyltransferase [Anaerolineales bacterium]